MAKLIITGANGFIGSHITREFCKNKISLDVLARKNAKLDNIKGLPINIKYGDVTDYKSLEKAFKNHDFVIHNAGYVKDWGNYEHFYNINVLGTINVIMACINNNIKNIIMTGTVSVYGEENCKNIKDENTPFNSHYKYFLDKIFPCKMNYYRDTKTMAVKKATEIANANGINLTILEPVWVYGEREFNVGFYEYVKTAKEGMPFMPGSNKNYYHVIYAGDLAHAYYLAFKKKLKGVNRFIIGNQKINLQEEVFREFCKVAGYKKPKNLPKVVFYPIGFIMELISTIINTKNTPLLTRARVNMFYDSIQYSTAKAKKILGFINEVEFESGVKKTIEWYKANGYLSDH